MANNTKSLFGKPVVSIYNAPRETTPITIQDEADVKIFLTGFNGTSQVNYQLNYAFNDDAFVYVFGERLSIITVEGIGFSGKVCEGGSNTKAYDPQKFIDFYNKHKLKIESPSQVTFTVSGMVFSGYFVALAVRLINDREDFYQFTFSLLGRTSTNGGTSGSL